LPLLCLLERTTETGRSVFYIKIGAKWTVPSASALEVRNQRSEARLLETFGIIPVGTAHSLASIYYMLG